MIANTFWRAKGRPATETLATLETVDGAGSGLDSDLLDGKHASEFQPNTGLDSARIAQDFQIFEYLNYGAM
jgi:hypothetical protein